VLKLADFGLGGVTAVRAAQVSRIGATTVDQLTVADQASLFRGAGTPLYMAPEQRRGQAPDPRHDLYSMGVMWYQLLVGDVSRELHPGWAKELTLRFGAPRRHIELIERCVGWFDERPRNAGELLALMREKAPAESAAPAPLHVRVEEPAPLPAQAPPTVSLSPVQGTGWGRPAAEVTARPAEGMREELLHSLVKSVGEYHRTLAEQDQKLTGVLGSGAGAGMVAFFVLMSYSHSAWASMFAALVVGGGVGGGLYLVQLGRRGEARERLAQAIRTLVAEFPEVVRGWGGEAVLHNPELVKQVIQRLERAPPPEEVAERLELPPLEPAQRKGLVAQLGPLAEKAEQADRYSRPRPVPFLLALFFGLALGAPIGLGVGHLIFGYRGPTWAWEVNGQLKRYYDDRENSLTEAQYHLENRRIVAVSVALGITTGLAACSLVVLLLARRRWHRLQLLTGMVLGLLVGGPAGAGVGLLHSGLNSPYWVFNWGGWQREYFDSRGNTISEVAYYLAERRSLTTSLVLGFGTGLVLLVLTEGLYQRWYRRRAEQARQALHEGVRQLAAGFPQVAAARGGPEGLCRPGEVAALLAAVEARA
jgi:hypothetical protein